GSAAANPDQVISSAKEMLGVRYRYGGQNPVSGFDCSGLVLFSYNRAGVNLPRTTIGQFKYSRPIKKSQMRAGDLLFFRISRSRISHVGIYLGDNEFIHAPSSGKKVSIGRLDSPYWSKRFVRAGRV
ncbi:MAG: C40 family peptidase, partial [Gammaproteobacteria bacterium]|nr:C40 family peptidase [Gammaproteobacteria bacterium]